MSKTELKPCPFCGSEVEAMAVSYGVAGVITCKNCKTKFVLPWNEAETQKDLFEAWNKRAADKRQSEGEWLTDRFGLERSICSVCGAVFEGDGGNFCRRCGAKMKGVSDGISRRIKS